MEDSENRGRHSSRRWIWSSMPPTSTASPPFSWTRRRSFEYNGSLISGRMRGVRCLVAKTTWYSSLEYVWGIFRLLSWDSRNSPHISRKTPLDSCTRAKDFWAIFVEIQRRWYWCRSREGRGRWSAGAHPGLKPGATNGCPCGTEKREIGWMCPPLSEGQ